MFPLSDPLRRLLCRTAFVLVGVLPMAAIACWCAWWHSDAPVRGAADALARRLGLTVTLRALQHPRPGVLVYQGLQVIDPETGRTLLRCRSVEVRTNLLPASADGPELVVHTEKAELESRGLEELGRLMQQAMQGRLGTRDPRWSFSAGEVQLGAGVATQSIVDVQASMSAPPGGVQAELSFRVPKLNMPEPARIRVSRNRQISPPAAGFELLTGGAMLPCSLLALGIPQFERVGANARFSGYLWANQSGGGWQGEIRPGQWTNLDLGELLGDACQHKLTGTAQLTVQYARFRDGRVEEAVGTLGAGPGIVSRSLINAAVERLTLARGADPNTPGEFVPYEQLAAAFMLNSKGLQLQGRCSGIGPGSILVDRYCRLLGDPTAQPKPVAALLQLLVAGGDEQVPANRQCERLLRLLPLPEAESTVTARH